MIDALSRWFTNAPARLVTAGLWMFFAGSWALLCALLAQVGAHPQDAALPLVVRFPQLPTWFVPETAGGFTAALLMVCWGVWALGTGLRRARAMRA